MPSVNTANVRCLCFDSNASTSLCLGFFGFILSPWTPVYLTQFCLSLRFTRMSTSTKQSSGTAGREMEGWTWWRSRDSPSALCSGTLLPSWCLIRPFPRNPPRVPRYTLCGRSSLPDRAHAHTQHHEQARGGGRSGEGGREGQGKREKRKKEREILDSSSGRMKALLTTLLVFCTLIAALVSCLAFSTYSCALCTFDSMLFMRPPCVKIWRG